MSFAPDVKPATPAPEAMDGSKEDSQIDGVIGQLEVYESGTIKMRLSNGIVMDVSPALPYFLGFIQVRFEFPFSELYLSNR